MRPRSAEMTIAVVWKSEQTLWAAADTRFSVPGNTTAAQRITDHGPKLFPLAVTVRQPGTSGFFGSIALQTTIGFMYAGAIAPALATHSLCAAVLQNLLTHDRNPSLGEIVEFVRTCSERYMRGWGERWPDEQRWRFTALVLGW